MPDVSQQESLLTREFLEKSIKFEKDPLEKGRSSIAKVIAQFYSGEGVVVYLPDLPSDGDEKRRILYNLGIKLRAENGSIKEALFISEAWMVNSTSPDYDKVAPSNHPARMEVIVIAGRNEDNTRSAMALQPFDRDSKDTPIWKELDISISDDASDLKFKGILDDLFEGAAQVTVPEMKA